MNQTNCKQFVFNVNTAGFNLNLQEALEQYCGERAFFQVGPTAAFSVNGENELMSTGVPSFKRMS